MVRGGSTLHFNNARGEGERPREPKYSVTTVQIDTQLGLPRTLALPGLDS
jgi:hypothetical protein